jgi:hypothetical protein
MDGLVLLLQGHKEWLAEVHFLALVDNPFLVKLIGYCAEDGPTESHRLLVYEYMPNRGLDSHLFRGAPPILPWQARVKIALGAARGLAYLHEEMDIQVCTKQSSSTKSLELICNNFAANFWKLRFQEINLQIIAGRSRRLAINCPNCD